MASVTLPGASGVAMTIGGGTGSNSFIAQVIANSILIASTNGGVAFDSASVGSGGQTTLPPPTLTGSQQAVAIIPANASGTIVIPSGYSYVIDESTQVQTLTGSGNVQIVANDTAGGSYSLSGNSSLSASSGDNTVSGSGTYNIAIGGSGTNSIKATGHGTISGGTGSNTFVVTDTASSGTLLISTGNDVISLSGDHVSVLASGSNASINAGSVNRLVGMLEGQQESVFGGSGIDSIYSGGTQDVVLGGSGPLIDYDSGSHDTIAAFGATSPTIQAWGLDAMIFGGSNNMLVTLSGSGAQGENTLVAGSGAETVYLGTIVTNAGQTVYSANNVVLGGSGSLTITDAGHADTIAAFNASSFSLDATGDSGLVFAGTAGATASLSGSSYTLLGGSGTVATTVTGAHNEIIGGSGTLVANFVAATNEGSNVLLAGSGPTSVTANGQGDVIMGGISGSDGSLTVTDSGTGDVIAGFNASSVNVTAGGSQTTIYGGNHVLTASLGGSDAVVYGGSGAANLTISYLGLNNDDTVIGGSGALSLTDNGSGNMIAAFAASSANLTLNGNHDLVFGGFNALTGSVAGSNNTIIGGSGAASIAAGSLGGGNVFVGTSGTLTVADAGTGDTIAAFGAAASFVTVQGSNDLVFGGSNATHVTVGGSGDTLFGGSGAMTVQQNASGTGLVIWANSSNLTFTGSTAGATIIGSTGTTTITDGSVTLFGSSGGVVNDDATTGSIDFSAGAGNETLNAAGSSTNNLIAAGSGANSLVGGTGNDTFTAAAGSDTMTGGAGSNSFVFFSQATNGAHDYITDWSSQDALYLLGYGQTASQVLATASVSGSNMTIKLHDNTLITFDNVTSTSALDGKILSS